MNPIEASFTLALEHHQAGRLGEAETLYRQILASQPGHAGAWQFLGVLAHQMGRDEDAVKWIRHALELQPNDAVAWSNLGEAHRPLRQWPEAIAAFRRSIALQPDVSDVHHNLGLALCDAGLRDEAIQAYRRALQLRPGEPAWHDELGSALAKQERFAEAEAAFRRAIALQPDNAAAHNHLGLELARSGRVDEAIAEYRRTLQLDPENLEAWNNLSVVLIQKDDHEESLRASEEAIRLCPGFALAHYNLATTLLGRNRFEEAEAAFRRALAIDPGHLPAGNNLGMVLSEQGLAKESVEVFRQALQRDAVQPGLHSNLIYTLQFVPGLDAHTMAEEQQRWNRTFCEPFRPWPPHSNTRQPGRRLKIGYFSPDFRSHSAAFFLIPLLEAHDRQAHEIYCYASVCRPDAVTARLRRAADHWRDVSRLSEAGFAALVREDGIDILVDLAMHTAGNRLMTFVLKPAPVQVSWLAYPGSSGLSAIDYRLSDALLDPPGDPSPDTAEQVVRLPDAWCCYAPVEPFPEVPPLPAESTQIVTFGSLHQFRKIHEDLLHCWAKLLAAVPDSRLLMICPASRARERVQAIFAAHSIAVDRLELVEPCSWSEYVRLFERIDIALDSFPCSGITITCHALWMGVPVVTQSGATPVSRGGHTVLHTAGLSDWVTSDEEEYIRLAADWAADWPRLAELRRNLRSRMQASPLMDAPRFARHVEAAYRRMWQQWCGESRS